MVYYVQDKYDAAMQQPPSDTWAGRKLPSKPSYNIAMSGYNSSKLKSKSKATLAWYLLPWNLRRRLDITIN